MSSSDPLTSFPTTPRPSSRISPSFGNLGFFQCCGLPARTPHLASSMLRASPHPSFGNLGFFRCCGLPPRTSFQALIRESWRLPVLRATSPHPSFGNLGICQWCGLPARTSFQARLGFFQCCGLPARTPHSGILASSSAAGCQPAPLIRESWLLPVLRAASPPALIRESWHLPVLRAARPHPSFGIFHAAGQPSPLIWESWLLPVLRAATPHLLPSPHSGILASSSAAGCQPAPPSKPVLASSSAAACQPAPSKPSFGNLRVFQCCGRPARTSFEALRESWLLQVLRASPHRLPVLRFSRPYLGIFASRTFQALIRESWLLPVLRAATAPSSKPSFGNLGFFQCCAPPSKASFGKFGVFQCCGLPASPHLLPSPHWGILASSSAAGCQPAPPSKPSFGNLGFFRCCGLPARAYLRFFQCCVLMVGQMLHDVRCQCS